MNARGRALPDPVALSDPVARRARTHSGHVAVEASGERLTYAQLEARVASAAAALRELGVRRGEPVGVLMGNSLHFAVFAHAVPRSGAAFMPLNARLTAGEIEWQLRHARARTLIVDAAHAAAGGRAAAPASVAAIDAADERWTAVAGAGAAEASDDAGQSGGAIHSVIFTSGTSGRPKGALLTHGNFHASARASARNLGVDAADRWLACMPLFHVGGLSIVLRSAIYGTTAVLHERFEPEAVNRALRDDGVTLLSVVPAMLERMLAADGAPYPPSVRAVIVGGGPAPRALLEAASGRGLPVLQSYGLTEAASQVATLSAADALLKLGSAGLPLEGTSLRIEVEGREAAPGEEGEIVVAGPTVSPGYLNEEEATAGALRDGRLYTGDLGYRDEEGYLYVTGRRDDMIVTGGENVQPAEVEAALLAHPAVADCAVVGVPDTRWGSAVVAVVVPAEGCAPAAAELKAHLHGRIAGYKVPKRFEFSEGPLPRTASGKLLRRVVRERLTADAR